MRISRYFKQFCFWIGLSVLAVSAIVAFYVWTFMSQVPALETGDFSILRKAAEKRVDEKLKGAGRRSAWTSLGEISQGFKFAVIISEDSTFFRHEGVNFDAVKEAAIKNLESGKYSFGASTISQQVVKNLFLTNEKTLLRKIKEAYLTVQIEKFYSKKQILEAYFNVAEFGPRVYGARAAASHYFKKSPGEVNAAEGAFMALMLPSPVKYHRYVFESENISKPKRQKLKRILRDMTALGYVNEQEYVYYTTNFDYFHAKTNRIHPPVAVETESAGDESQITAPSLTDEEDESVNLEEEDPAYDEAEE